MREARLALMGALNRLTVSQARQCRVLQLSYPLTTNAKFATDIFECLWMPPTQSKTHLEDASFSLRQGPNGAMNIVTHQIRLNDLIGLWGFDILEQFA